MLAMKLLLHPTDFSRHSAHAFQIACALAHRLNARLLVLHVIETLVSSMGAKAEPVPRELDRNILETQLRQLLAAERDIAMEYRFAEGAPAAAILKVARESGCDMIVMGTLGKTGLERLLMGSVAEEVVRKADCPVVTVKIPASSRTG